MCMQPHFYREPSHQLGCSYWAIELSKQSAITTMARTGQHPWLHPGWKILPTSVGYCSNTSCTRRFRWEDNNVDFTHMQPHYYRVRQVKEPCHRLGWSSQALFLNIKALGALPNRPQQQKLCDTGCCWLITLLLVIITVCKLSHPHSERKTYCIILWVFRSTVWPDLTHWQETFSRSSVIVSYAFLFKWFHYISGGGALLCHRRRCTRHDFNRLVIFDRPRDQRLTDRKLP